MERRLQTVERLLLRLRDKVGGWGTLRASVVAVIPLALLPWLLVELHKELASPLFRDAAQCQYSGWCLLHGFRLYRDVGAPDGPLIHFLHAFMQILAAGPSDRGCRWADLFIQLTGSGVMGAALAPRSAETPLGRALSRIAWAGLGAALWLTWYLDLGWGQTIQRDGYFALLGYCGLVLVYASADFSPRGATIAATAGGALCFVQVFGRHSGIAYPASALLTIWFSTDPVGEQRRVRLKAALLGALGALVAIFLLLLLFGSIRGLWFWYFKFPFTFHRWLAKQNAWFLLTQHYGEAAKVALVVLVGVIAAVAVRAVPLRAIGFAFLPMLMLLAACIEGKGWPNHVQQTTSAVVPIALLILSEIWGRRPSTETWGLGRRLVAALALMFITGNAIDTINGSGYLHMPVPQPVDSDIVAAKKVGDFLNTHTKPTDRVFMYGHESHVLINAARGPAVPYYCNMSLNIETFYERQPAAPGEGPNAKQRAAITDLQRHISADACQRLTSSPPGAMVFLDNSLGLFLNARAEVFAICPPVQQMLKTQYAEVSVPGGTDYHVYLRKP